MTHQPKFAVGHTVYKHTGNYGGPGIIRGIANAPHQPLRYLVGHTIEGGYGEFYHVYAEGNLREVEALNDLPNVTKEQGLQSRIGQATPNDSERTELVNALVEAHVQVDQLMAMVITLDKSFMPSQSTLWPEIVRRVELIRKYEGVL